MLRFAFRATRNTMKQVYIYHGHGMYEKDSVLLHRELTIHLKEKLYSISYITPEQIKAGLLHKDVALLAIGGGFDLGLIEALGQDGMKHIREYVQSGGRYLGICSGAYFATDYIEFDKGGPLEVVGDRFLKFYPGVSVGPLYKKYIYKSTDGAVTSHIYFNGLPNYSDKKQKTFHCSSEQANCDDRSKMNGYTDIVRNGKVDESRNTFHFKVGTCSKDENEKCHCYEFDKRWANGKNLGTENGLYAQKDNMPEYCSQSIASQPNGAVIKADIFSKPFRVFFNGGGYFTEKSKEKYFESVKCESLLKSDSKDDLKLKNGTKQHKPLKRSFDVSNEHCSKDDSDFNNVTILSRYLDLPNQPVAAVKCKVDRGTAVLSFTHFEYDSVDVIEDNVAMDNIKDELDSSKPQRKEMFRAILEYLDVEISDR